MSIVQIAIDVPINTLFDYMDQGMELEEGSLVVIPFRGRKKIGVVLKKSEKTTYKQTRLKSVQQVLPLSPLSTEFLELAEFASSYYCYPIGQVVATFLPAYVRSLRNTGKYQIFQYGLNVKGRLSDTIKLKKNANALRKLKYLLMSHKAVTESQIRKVHKNGIRAIEKWVVAGWVSKFKVDLSKMPYHAENNIEVDVTPSKTILTSEQFRASNKIWDSRGTFKVWLLHGVTGSGKTEIYLDLIKKIALSGGQVLVLIPEINLSPQLEDRFRTFLPFLDMCSMNSRMADGARFKVWEAARQGNIQLVLGTRLAVAAELPKLSLIIVDEEHDSSFKQKDGLRYSARDLAIYRAKKRKIPIVLGSATPSLETYKNSLDGKFEKITIRSRPVVQLPDVIVINIQNQRFGLSICPDLIRAIKKRILANEQTLIYINRRGFATSLICNTCGWVSECTRCSAKLTFHKSTSRLICHYCGHWEMERDSCHRCGSPDLFGLGDGTQRVEEDLKSLFPAAGILRVDSDSTKGKDSFVNMRKKILEGTVDIIVGTQMLTKGHNFPRLTLVGIVGADSALYSPDYMATEKLFQQLIQVSGRAGRGSLYGEVLVQTYFDKNVLFDAVKNHDFDTVAKHILKERQEAGFPPFVYQVIIRAESRSEKQLFDFLEKVANLAEKASQDVSIYDPSPAIISKIADHYRGQLLIQAKKRHQLSSVLSKLFLSLQKNYDKRVRWVIDRDPHGL